MKSFPDKNLGECIQEQMKRQLGRGRKVVWGIKADLRAGDRGYGVSIWVLSRFLGKA